MCLFKSLNTEREIFLVMIFENLQDYGCEELAFFYDAIYMESKHNTVEEIRKKVTLNPTCHPCPQYGRRASGRPSRGGQG